MLKFLTKKTNLVLFLLIILILCSVKTSSYAALSKSVLMKGDTIKYTGSSTWTAYKTKAAATLQFKPSKSKIYKSGCVVTIQAIKDNILKIADKQFLNYTTFASKHCAVLSHTDSNNLKFTLYRQNSSEFKDVSYPGRYKGMKSSELPKNYNKNPNIGANGCGPTSCAIVASGYGFKDTPKTIVKDGNNYSTANGIKNFFENKGFTVKVFNKLSDNKVKEYLNAGYKIIVLVDYNGKVGDYTCNGYQHWYTLLDISGNKVYVGDPLSGHGGLYSLSNLTNRITHICIKK